MHCEQCGRIVNAGLRDCPQRDQDKQSCPFQVEENRLPSGGWGCLLLFGIVLSLISVVLAAAANLPALIDALLAIALVLGLLSIGVGVYRPLGKQMIVYNLQTGETWQQTTIFGIPTSQQTISRAEMLPWKGGVARVMRYPASVVELFREGKAIAIFNTALLYLMAQDVIRLGYVIEKRRRYKERKVFIFTPGDNLPSAEIDGELEKRIAAVVRQASAPDAELVYKGKPHPRTYRTVLCLLDLILGVFEGETTNAGNWLMGQIVGAEAESLELGEVSGKVVKRFRFALNSQKKLAPDVRSVDLLHKEFWDAYPDLASELFVSIDYLMMNLVLASEQE